MGRSVLGSEQRVHRSEARGRNTEDGPPPGCDLRFDLGWSAARLRRVAQQTQQPLQQLRLAGWQRAQQRVTHLGRSLDRLGCRCRGLQCVKSLASDQLGLKCAHEELEDVGACARLHCAGAKARQWNGSATVDQWNWIIGSGSGVCKG